MTKETRVIEEAAIRLWDAGNTLKPCAPVRDPSAIRLRPKSTVSARFESRCRVVTAKRPVNAGYRGSYGFSIRSIVWRG